MMMKKLIAVPAFTALALCAAGCEPPRPQAVPIDQMPVVFQTSFDKEDPQKWQAVDPDTPEKFRKGETRSEWRLKHWYATDAKSWKIVRQDGNGYLSLYRESDYNPRARSPRNYILLPNVAVSSFVLDVKVQSASPTSPVRSLCILFGYQNPSQYYYVHLGDKLTDTGHTILVVDGQPRRPIAEQRSKPLTWGDAWHAVRVVRRWSDGTIEVYVDDMSAPIMVAHDQRFDLGRIGIGAFDDLGNFGDIKVRGVQAEKLPPLNPEDVPPPDLIKKSMGAARKDQLPPPSKEE